MVSQRIRWILRSAEAPNLSVRAKALSALRKLPIRSIEKHLKQILQHPSEQLRAQTLLQLGMHRGRKHVKTLCHHLLYDPSSLVRATCATVIEPPFSQACEQALLQALKHPDWRVVLAALTKMPEVRSAAKVSLMESLLNHPRWTIRFAACEALIRSGVIKDQILKVIESLCQSSEASEQDQEVQGLEQLGVRLGVDLSGAWTTGRLLDEARQLRGVQERHHR